MSDFTITSTKGQEMLGFLPKCYEASKIMKSILQTEGLEFDDIWSALNDILKQFYVETATWGLDIWEKELGLSSYAGKPDDQRRSRIISKLRGMGTVNVALIQNVAESYVYGTVSVTDHPETYSFTIKFIDSLGVPPNLQDLKNAIDEIKPAHLAITYEYKYLLISDIHNVMTISTMQTHKLTDFAPFEPVL